MALMFAIYRDSHFLSAMDATAHEGFISDHLWRAQECVLKTRKHREERECIGAEEPHLNPIKNTTHFGIYKTAELEKIFRSSSYTDRGRPNNF
jgi:hypothetical protein